MRTYQPADVLNMEIMGPEQSMHGLFDHLRETDPVAWVEHPEYRPFWSLSRYDDIKSIGSQNEKFLSAPRTILLPTEVEDLLCYVIVLLSTCAPKIKGRKHQIPQCL